LAHRARLEIPNSLFRDVQNRWWNVIRDGGWGVQYLSNHDGGRQVSTYGNDGAYRVPSAKLLATLIHTMPGTPFVYQGEEIGMTNVTYGTIEDHNCCYTLGEYRAMVANGKDPAEALRLVEPTSRDNARTPYQWDDSENGGFTVGTPWIKVNPRYREINLKNDLASPDSIFSYYQKLFQMRKEHPAIVEGDLSFYLEESETVLMYTRGCEKETLLVIANRSSKDASFHLPEAFSEHQGELVLSNARAPRCLQDTMTLAPWEVVVFSLSPKKH
jgi:oligo-1,6-glucosidase